MVIAVNTRLLIKDKLEGIGWFTYETLKRITKAHPEHQFIFIFDRKWDESFVFSDNIIPVKAFPPTRHPVLWFFWFEFVIPWILKKYKADVFLSPDGFVSLRTKTPTITVIHDINFKHRPDDLPWLLRNYYNYFFPHFAQKAKHICTVSEYSKKDIAKSYNIVEDKISVVYNGANSGFIPLSTEVKSKVKEKYANAKDYFIYIGAIHPRKNVDTLLRAFDLFKSKYSVDFKLLIVGGDMHGTAKTYHVWQNMQHKKDVVFTGRVGQEELFSLLGAAYALTFVPFFEGFGIPIIEAMNCNVPIITSDRTSLPEVGGSAAIYVNPSNADEIAQAMATIYFDKEQTQELIETAKVQRKKFSWDKTAERFWEAIESHFL